MMDCLTFDGRIRKPCYTKSGKRNKKAYIRFASSDIEAAIIISNEDPSVVPGERLCVLKFRDGGSEYHTNIMEDDLRSFAGWILKNTDVRN